MAIIWSKNKNLIKNSGWKLEAATNTKSLNGGWTELNHNTQKVKHMHIYVCGVGNGNFMAKMLNFQIQPTLLL